MDFGEALRALNQGKKVQRAGWNGKGMWLELQTPDEHSKMRQPYVFIVPVGGEPVPWVPSQPDLLSADWSVLE